MVFLTSIYLGSILHECIENFNIRYKNDMLFVIFTKILRFFFTFL